MAKIKSDLKGNPVPEVIQTTRNRHKALIDEGVKVVVDNTKVTSYDGAITTLEVKEGAVSILKDKLKNAIAERDDARENLEKIDLSIVNEINGKTDDVNILLTTGFPLAAERGSAEPIEQVTNISAAIGDEAGEIDINFDRVVSASGYEFQISADSPENWVNAGASGKTSRFTFKGLTSGRKYWIRCRALKGEEKGTWSNPVSATAPH